jgi:DNA-binding transcriptional MerR regulator
MDPGTKSEAAEITGLDPRTIQFYTDRKAVTPVEGGGSRGAKMKYDRDGLFMLCLIKKMYDFGMTIDRITDVARLVEKWKRLDLISEARKSGGGICFISIKIEKGRAIPSLHEMGQVYDDTIAKIMSQSDAVLLIDAGKILDKLND